MYIHLCTKDQLFLLFKAWNIAEQLPKKSKKVVVAFPKDAQVNFSLAEIYVHDQKSTNGKTLYKVVMFTHTDLENKVDGYSAQPKAFWGFQRGKRS